jgi:MurNAc alpha-1-phosphate uridylyltransferase
MPASFDMTGGREPFSFLSDTAMVLAAGFGVRMRPLTLDTPKPLLKVGGRTMLDLAIDHLVQAGMRRVVVNTHYLAENIARHVQTRDDIEIVISHEPQILDTGGGMKNARACFGDKPFIALGGELPFTDGKAPALTRMARAWDHHKMDQLLMVSRREKARGFGPDGDFMMRPDGRLWRKDAPKPRDYVFLSAQIVRPQLYDDMVETVFSNNKLFDISEEKGRLFGLEHDGACFHVGTPEDLAQANRLLETQEGWG